MQNIEKFIQFIDDYEDLINLRNAKEEDKGKAGVGIDDVIAEFERQIES